MNSQNRMNAGAEYVLYRIYGALLEPNGIHPESLLTCVGALAGYACQACVRQTALQAGANPGLYLTAVTTRNGAPYFDGDALDKPLADSPLSVWSFVSRAVRKLNRPVPDIDDIVEHVSRSMGTNVFGIPRVPAQHRARHLAIVYLKQIWPQILPIAQRFCSKPAQLPVLFGIAVQRAIEQLQEQLDPTLGATIAMECAVAMSKVALPGDAPVVSASPAPTTEISAAPAPLASLPLGIRVDTPALRTPTIAATRNDRVGVDTSNIRAFVSRFPPATRVVTIMSVAFIAAAGLTWRPHRAEPPQAATQSLRTIQTAQLQTDTPPPAAFESVQPQLSARALPQEQAVPPDPVPTEYAPEAPLTEDEQRQLDMSSSDGTSEMVVNTDYDPEPISRAGGPALPTD